MDALSFSRMFNFDDIEASFLNSLADSNCELNTVEEIVPQLIESLRGIEKEDMDIVGQSTSFAIFELPPPHVEKEIKG